MFSRPGMRNIPRLLLSDVGGSLGHIQEKRGMASKRWLHVSSRGSSPSHQESALCWRSNRPRIALFLALYPFSHYELYEISHYLIPS